MIRTSTPLILLLTGACRMTEPLLPGALPADHLGPPSVLTLTASTYAIRGTAMMARVSGATPQSTVVLVAGAGGTGPCPPVLGGSCLDVGTTFSVVGTGRANGSGIATLTYTLPAATTLTAAKLQAASGTGPALSAAQDIEVLSRWDDADDDGLWNLYEHATLGTDPLRTDTDGDGLQDGEELFLETDPLADTSYTARTIFVGSVATTGRIGFPAGTDRDYCATLAAAAGHSGLYVALVSTTMNDAIDRVDDVIYRRPDGRVVAGNALDLFDGDILHAPSLNEYYVEQEGEVYTGTNEYGVVGVNRHCEDWSAAFGGLAWIGSSSHADGRWALDYESDCDTPRSYYCVEVRDGDSDGLSDADEAWRGTDPALFDTDGDGSSDGDEVYVLGTDPTVPG